MSFHLDGFTLVTGLVSEDSFDAGPIYFHDLKAPAAVE